MLAVQETSVLHAEKTHGTRSNDAFGNSDWERRVGNMVPPQILWMVEFNSDSSRVRLTKPFSRRGMRLNKKYQLGRAGRKVFYNLKSHATSPIFTESRRSCFLES